MATTRSLKARSAAKKKRDAADVAAKVEAKKQEAQMNELVREGHARAKKAPEKPLKTRAQMKAEAAEAAEKQAAKDAVIEPKDPEIIRTPGRQPTLHELNTEARATDRRLRDEARTAANAAGKAAYSVLRTGASETDVSLRQRHRNMGKARSRIAKQEQAAAKEGS